ncbi:MAG: universal stress protein [Pseudomonadota bacterium]
MKVRSILCAFSGDAAQGSGLRHAVRLARHHDAHLTGVVRHGVPALEQRFAPRIRSALLTELRSADAAHIAEIAERFQTMVAAEGLGDQAEFLEIEPAKDGPLSEFAHAFDLIVTGVHSDAANEAHLSANPDILALKSGRPVLVVPDAYDSDALADRALVAWDGKRSATRAIGDAMAILAEKSHVTLLSVGKTPRGTDRMVDNMRRHGVTVEARTVDAGNGIAASILRGAASDGARLIVTGAFEHSKFSHDLFGGVSTDVIARTDVPVLMAH